MVYSMREWRGLVVGRALGFLCWKLEMGCYTHGAVCESTQLPVCLNVRMHTSDVQQVNTQSAVVLVPEARTAKTARTEHTQSRFWCTASTIRTGFRPVGGTQSSRCYCPFRKCHLLFTRTIWQILSLCLPNPGQPLESSRTVWWTSLNQS